MQHTCFYVFLRNSSKGGAPIKDLCVKNNVIIFFDYVIENVWSVAVCVVLCGRSSLTSPSPLFVLGARPARPRLPSKADVYRLRFLLGLGFRV